MRQRMTRLLALGLAVSMVLAPMTTVHAEELNIQDEITTGETEEVQTVEEVQEAVTENPIEEAVEKPAEEAVENTAAQENTEVSVTPEISKTGSTPEKLNGMEEPQPEKQPQTPSVKEDKLQIVKADGTAYKMFSVVSSEVTKNGDKLDITMTASRATYTSLYLGSYRDEVKTSVIGSKNTESGQTFTFSVPASWAGTAHLASLGKADGSWYSNQELWLYVPSEVSSETKEEDTEITETGVVPKDGIYTASADTGGLKMFRVVDAKLTVRDGKMKALITLSGTGYDYLYMGTGAEALLNGQEKWIKYTKTVEYTDEDGAVKTGKQYEIPVEALDKKIQVASRSNNYAKDPTKGPEKAWFDRTITFSSADLKLTDTDNEKEPAKSGEGTASKGGNSQSGEGQKKPSENTKPAEESKHKADTNGSTSAVDSSTSLKDGTYTPDSFSFSGGTGKVNITCPQVTVTGGKAFATIVFSSTYYQYVKANGNTYYGTKGAGSTSFVIPVDLNKNNQIIGMTTRMGTPHEIKYSIFVYLAAADKDGSGSGAASLDSSQMSKEAPKIIGLEYEDQVKLEHAELFQIFDYQDGIQLIEIDMKKYREEADQEEQKEAAEAGTPLEQLRARLYQQDIVRYLLVPEGKEVPAGLDKEMIIVELPIEHAYVAEEQSLDSLAELDVLDAVSTVGVEEKECKNDKVLDAMKAGDISFGGTYDDLNYKTIIKEKADLAVLPSEVLPGNTDEKLTKKEKEDKDNLWKELAEKMATLEIPMIVDRSADEKDPEAVKEWNKVFAALFGKEAVTEE